MGVLRGACIQEPDYALAQGCGGGGGGPTGYHGRKTQEQAESEGMVLFAYAKPESPAVALRENRVLYLPTDIHALLVNKRSSSPSSSPFSLSLSALLQRRFSPKRNG